MKLKSIKNNRWFFLFLFNVLMMSSYAQAQSQLIDKIVAQVGDKIILLSDVEAQRQQMMGQGMEDSDDLKCSVLQELIFQKMMLTQAETDSVKITEEQVEQELNKKVRYFVQQIGSVEKLENYLGKTINQIKDEYRDKIREQMLVQQIQQKIAGEVKVSPGEVVAFFNRLPKDSLPMIASEVQVAQLLRKPEVNVTEKLKVRKEIERIRKEIIEGRNFASMAVIYSQDPGSATKGGELGFVGRGDLVPEFEAAAFNLKGKEISDVIETVFGYHIMQLIERRGENINVRHILLTPKASASDLEIAANKCDSIYKAIMAGRITFEKAVEDYSDDKETKYNGGLITNPASGGTYWELSQLDQQIFFVIDKLKVGEISEPNPVRVGDKKEAYRILKLVTRSEPHFADITTDYSKIQMAAESEKRQQLLFDWVKKKRKQFYIRIDPAFDTCDFAQQWNINQTN